MANKEHCWCNLTNSRIGVMVDPEDASYMRAGVPLCSEQCAHRYDEIHDLKASRLARVNGHGLAGLGTAPR